MLGEGKEVLRQFSPFKLYKNVGSNIADQRDRWFLWYPIAIIVGISGYFALPREPHMLVFWAALVVALVCATVLLRQRNSFKLFLAFCLLVGFIAAKTRTEIVHPKTLLATTPTIEISGWVERMEARGGRRARLLLHLETAKGIKPSALPELVRLSGKAPDAPLFYGDRVQLRGRLFPLPGPVKPRGYDFGRKLWFEGIGATGFYYGTIKKTGEIEPGIFALKRNFQKLRHLIGRRIAESLPGRAGGIAIALITGDRGRMEKNDTENFRKAGLAHVLAISGLHMSLVAGGMFWLIRALLALSGPLALNYPIKKWAAIAGLCTGAFYLVVSGASISTQRAFIMLFIMFTAILLDRPAISLRNLAIAALIIILARPETVFSAGFQMSFMAVAGLIGFYELVRGWRANNSHRLKLTGPISRPLAKGVGFFMAIATTTTVASVFTGLPAAYHFHRIAVFSILGNLVALPIVSLIVMPGAIVTILLMPLGLEFVGTAIMKFGIDLVVDHADYVAQLPNAQVFTPDLQTVSSLILAGGMLWFCLWRGWLKAAAVVPVVLGLATIVSTNRPDILVSKFGRNVAMRDSQGLLVIADSKKSRFAARNWLVSNGEGVSVKQAAARTGWQCEVNVCTANVSGKKTVYLKKGAKPTSGLCEGLDILISAEPLRDTCKDVAIRVDRFDLWRHGAHAIYLTTEKSKIETASGYRGHRPWVIRPIARRKILINPDQHRRYRDKPRKPGQRQRGASIAPQQSGKSALHLHPVGAENAGFIGRVGRFQSN